MYKFALVCLGGAAGTAARYLIVLGFTQFVSRKHPSLAILFINVAGSFAIGFLIPWATRHSISPAVLAALATGFLGGFTTYSAFNFDLTAYLSAGDWWRGMSYLGATVLGGLLAGFAGLHLGR